MSEMPTTIAGLREAYARGEPTPTAVVEEAYRRIGEREGDATWIALVPREAALKRAAELERGPRDLPLWGVPFAVKDNIDVEGLPTTAACPGFAYTPQRSAAVVQRLLGAGAILIGKTNLDQFATGLVGTRSPYGAPRCVYNPDYVSGGSSSGSAVAVAARLVAFALGTDTAGSGRVPAAFNHLVGLKPTRGRIAATGVVPACRSLDCVSVFAHASEDAAAVLRVAEGADDGDPYSRAVPGGRPAPIGDRFRFGVPRADQLQFFGDAAAAALYEQACARLERIGGERVTFDLAPFREAAELLYAGPWVAERDAAVGDFLRKNPTAAHPVVRTIIGGAARHGATRVFRAMYRLEELRRVTERVWQDVDVLALPTTGTIYKVDEVLAEPYALNATLGYYTNFMNLLDLCGVALPAGFRGNGTPFGITLAAPAWMDDALLALGARYEAGADWQVPPRVSGASTKTVRLAVVGAHLAGMPLNHQLASRGARLAWSGTTAATYRLYAMANSTPPKPALVHDVAHGSRIALEVWELDVEAFGSFVAEVPPPLAIGSVTLETGETVKGFVCEPRAVEGATEITHLGGWRAYVASLAKR